MMSLACWLMCVECDIMCHVSWSIVRSVYFSLPQDMLGNPCLAASICSLQMLSALNGLGVMDLEWSWSIKMLTGNHSPQMILNNI